MNNFNSLYPLRRIHGIVHEWLERKKKKWKFILYICYPLGAKYYVLGTPQHTNLGDSAIVLSEISFLKQCGIREKRIKEVTTEEYKEYKDILKARIRKSDKIFLHGGGNMGDQWFGEELLRRDMLSTFEENKIIIFPQTIFYSDTTKGQKEEKNSILLHNKEAQIKQEQINKAKDNIRLCETVQNEISEELTKIKQQKNIANKLKRLTIEKQKQEINKYLNKVNLEFCRENITNDKITECCDVSYEGREYKKLSKSQQARAGLEISNLFNNLSGLKAPIFLDDAESITDIQEIRNTQIIVSLVIKYNPLEVLYDYSEVLARKKASIERESKEKEEFIIEQAA